MDFIYNLSSWLFFLVCIGATIVFAVVGLLGSRPWVRRHADEHSVQNDLVSYFLGASGVIYGIALGLVAAGVWSNFQTLSGQVDEEAAITGAIYQDLGAYPMPQRQALQSELRDYVQLVIQKDWPQLHQGKSPQASTVGFLSFKRLLLAFAPTTPEMKLVHEQTLVQFNDLSKIRRLRLRGNEASLPAVLWWIIILGAVINIIVTWFFVTEHLAYHLILTILLALLLGSLLFLTASMDNPFRGEFNVDAEAFKLILAQMPANGSH